MHNRFRISLYGMMIALLSLASAFTVIPARADDGAPPPPASPAGPSAKTASTASVLSTVPAGTDVVVVDRSGHKVALASQQAADMIASGDPIWCPFGALPKPGVGGCTLPQTYFTGGLLPLIIGKTVNGTIWIAPGYSSAGEGGSVTFDGTLTSTAAHSLTINGGWNGITGSTILNPNAPSVFNVPLTISSWTNAVTLNNITIAGTAGDGLTVGTSGNIVLNNIDAASNSGYGAILITSSSTGATGTVTVNYSTFTGNNSDGLNIYAKRAVSLKNVNAVDNSDNGVTIDNTIATSAQPVTITGVNNFSSNGTGLYVRTNGAITLGNVTADYNTAGDGVNLDNCSYNTGSDLCDTPGANNITIKGTNSFNNNGADVLEAFASGIITANNLTADNNGTIVSPATNIFGDDLGMGVYLDNYGAPSIKALTLTGTNTFTGNNSTGLYLNSFGAIKVNNITANENGFYTNCLTLLTGTGSCDGMHVDISMTFTLTGYGTFNGNNDDGLEAYSGFGNMALTNLSADSNGGWGVYVDNCWFDPGSPPTTPASCGAIGNVSITGTNTFTNNGFTGLNVYTSGIVSLTNINASFNGLALDLLDGAGAWIDNCNVDTVTSLTCVVTVPKPVTLTGVNTFNGNNLDGLDILSLGAITAKQVTADGNVNGNGAYLDNQWGFKNFNITLSGNNVFNTNGDIGLLVYSNGSIILSNITANENTNNLATGSNSAGAYLDNLSMTIVPVAITLTGINTFNNNGNGISGFGSGLAAYSDGAITISNLTANNNRENGAYLDNTTNGFGPLRNITLTGVNNFMNNLSGSGLQFSATGAVTLNQVTADLNGSNGVLGTAAGKILITCGSMSQNIGGGGYVLTGLTVTLKGVYTGLNGSPNSPVTPTLVVRACPIP